MNRNLPLKLLITVSLFVASIPATAQLQVAATDNAQALAQKLVGEGVIISNATLTPVTTIIPTGFFYNQGNTNINIDSGIVLTSGRAQSDFRINKYGVDGNGSFPASIRRADNNLGLPGDATLAAELGIPVSELHDAIALEFDFIPLGDTIKFNYILSSEEYTQSTVCIFNDAFGFFISGPGIAGSRNIALIPGSIMPVTITNVNNIPTAGCVNNAQYYIDNTSNIYFVHEGHTSVFTAISRVQPCETYHLKIVIADRGDHLWDSGVFLQAKSLTSNAIAMTNLTQTDPQGNSYLVEGCATGAFNVRRPRRDPTALNIQLSYSGTALNGIDYLALPTSVTIPPNDSVVTVNLVPIVDGISEGTETIKVYALAACSAGTPIDSTIIQLRDFDTLNIRPGNTDICRNSSVQLNASGSFSSYQWNVDPGLSSLNIRNPVATPVNNSTTYICTANEGTCYARDSLRLQWKELELVAKQNVNCRGGNNGSIHVSAGAEWHAPVEYSLDGVNWRADSMFNGLRVGSYSIKVRDATCMDSILVNVTQTFPDLLITNLISSPASCSGNPDGALTVTASGGNGIYQYSKNGTHFQPTNNFNLSAGAYRITTRDGNGCLTNQDGSVSLNNNVSIHAGVDKSICEGSTYRLAASSNASTFSWTPASTLSDPASLSPIASPAGTTTYVVTASTGICSRRDSLTVTVWPAPVANAGPDVKVCYGKTIQLTGSGGMTYQWVPATNFVSSTSLASPALKAKQSVVYKLTVRDDKGCPSLSSDELTLDVTPAVKIFAGNDTVSASNQPIQLKAFERGAAGITSYSWSPGTYLNNSTIATPVATLTHDQRYVVTATTTDGCEGMDDVVIKVYKGPEIYVPSGFTPDNNGLNDIIKPTAVGIKEFRFFRIYNRWGQVIFSTQDPTRGWDGRISGIEQPSGTFIWLAEAVDYKGNLINRKGVVTIIR